MQAEEYNRRGKELVDYITEYLTTIRERKVAPDVKPGYMKDLLPDCAPTEPEDWDCIFQDIEKVIMPGVLHWQSPHMHAYFPALSSWPSMLGEMLSDAINCIGFTWASCPASTELEINVMDWLCKALGLPSFFLHHHPNSIGGGVIQGSVSESTLISLLAARNHRILQLKKTYENQDQNDSVLNSRLVAYASDQAHSSVEKAGLISLVKIRFLAPDEHFSLRGETLRQAIQEDKSKGLIPVMLCATLGTTGVCAFDNLSELGPVCAEEGVWLHVDAAYAGSAFLCPELRWCLEGIQYADSFVFNPSKWMMVHFDCTALWVKDKYKLQQTFSVDPLYLRHENSEATTDFMHWQIPLSRRFRSLKLWFVMRSFGLKNLQGHIRHGVEMAKLFESLVRSDPNFEVPAERNLGLVVFCLKGGNALTQELLRRLTRSGTMYLIPAEIQTKRIIRFAVTSQFTTSDDIHRDWDIIHNMATTLLAEQQQPLSNTDEISTCMRGESESLKNGTANVVETLTPAAAPAPTPAAVQAPPGEQLEDVQGQAGPETGAEVITYPAQKAEIICPAPIVKQELWIDKDQASLRRVVRSLSCSSEPLPSTNIEPLSVYNSEPNAGPTDPYLLPFKASKLKPLSTSGGGLLIKIREGPPNQLRKRVGNKLRKFYSMPSFCHLLMQCGRYQLCCPLSSLKVIPRPSSPTRRKNSCLSNSTVAKAAVASPGLL